MTFLQFSKTLKAERERLGVSQSAAAKICDVHLRTIAAWEGREDGAEPNGSTMDGALFRLRNSEAMAK